MDRGIYAAVLTPLRADLACDAPLLARHSLDLIRRGCNGVLLFGTTGEGPSFSTSEKREALKEVVEKGLPPDKILLGNGSACLPDTVEMCALAAGCLAALVAPPSFYKGVEEAGVIAFYREVIRRTGDPKLKLLLYHIPQYTGVPITKAIVERLSQEFPSVVTGVKESEGNLELVRQLSPLCQVFEGSEILLNEAMKAGASGAICGMANLWPELLSSAMKGERLEELEQAARSIRGRSFIAASKALLFPDAPFVRPPLTALGKS